ncbi:hypothetical protein EDD18DRAFT_1384559 [Armillaria luteobubalina]|uniref:Uncharacterized protein n=1 Tax=Armillaria luteobubalina TaxID=153913 RepID=A0AA39TQB1_9AGAR|nr:hypothetical protein EDD18DRAFT_1384559 [Armillaria luteobubalina]
MTSTTDTPASTLRDSDVLRRSRPYLFPQSKPQKKSRKTWKTSVRLRSSLGPARRASTHLAEKSLSQDLIHLEEAIAELAETTTKIAEGTRTMVDNTTGSTRKMIESFKDMVEDAAKNVRYLVESTRQRPDYRTETTESIRRCLAIVQEQDATLRALLDQMSPFSPQKVDGDLTENFGDLGSMEHSKSLKQHIIPVTFPPPRCAFHT